MEQHFFLGALACVALSSAACSQADEAPVPLGTAFAASPLQGDGLAIRIADGRVFHGEPVAIEITAALPGGPPAVASFTLSTADLDGQGLSVTFDLPPKALLGHSFSVDVGRFPGAGTMAHQTSSGARLISAGRVLLQAREGRITGSFQAADESFPAGTIEGRYEVACLVTPEQLGLVPNGAASEGAWMLVEDEAQSSDFCRAFQGY